MLGQLGLLEGLEQWIALRLNRLAVDHIIHAPLGVYCALYLRRRRCPFSGTAAKLRDLRSLPLQIRHGSCPVDSIASLTRFTLTGLQRVSGWAHKAPGHA